MMNRTLVLLACLAAASVLPSAALAQRGNARDFRWSKSLPAGQWVRIHNINGNVTVNAVDGDRVDVIGIRRAGSDDWEGDEDVRVDVHEGRSGVTICALWGADSYCDEDGLHVESHGRRQHGRVDFEVRLPRRLKLSANSVSGNVEVSGVGDEVRARSVSGDVRLDHVRAPSITGTSVSGDVEASVDALTGAGDLRFTSVSGNVSLHLPRSLDADVTLKTVSGELDSEFPLTIRGDRSRIGRRSISGTIGRGGRELLLTTVSGDVRLRAR
jgi:Putative adhesin